MPESASKTCSLVVCNAVNVCASVQFIEAVEGSHRAGGGGVDCNVILSPYAASCPPEFLLIAPLFWVSRVLVFPHDSAGFKLIFVLYEPPDFMLLQALLQGLQLPRDLLDLTRNVHCTSRPSLSASEWRLWT